MYVSPMGDEGINNVSPWKQVISAQNQTKSQQIKQNPGLYIPCKLASY